MADLETEKEWARSKQIEAEKMKAARALAEEKPDKVSLAFLDPKSAKVKGWSSDPNVIIADAERMSTRAVALAVGGAVITIIGYAGGMVTTTYNLGMAGVVISALPEGVGALCIAVGALMSLAVIVVEIYSKVKLKRKFTQAFWTASFTLGFIALCSAIVTILMNSI